MNPLVPHCQSEHLHEQLQSVGGKSELIIVADGVHGPGVMVPVYYGKMVEFFRHQMP